MKTRTPRSLRTQSLARVSTLAAITSASGAHAAIIFNNTTITSENSNYWEFTYWNIDGVGGPEVSLHNTSSSGFSHKDLVGEAGSFKIVANSNNLKGLPSNFLISSAISGLNFRGQILYIFLSSNLQNVDSITSGVSTYIGFRFNPAGTPLYGWADVTLTNGGSFGTFTINSWAYDDTGAAILTGSIPEPANCAVGLAARALGAAGLRRRRQARTVAA